MTALRCHTIDECGKRMRNETSGKRARKMKTHKVARRDFVRAVRYHGSETMGKGEFPFSSIEGFITWRWRQMLQLLNVVSAGKMTLKKFIPLGKQQISLLITVHLFKNAYSLILFLGYIFHFQDL